jgi:transposase InsO family protein
MRMSWKAKDVMELRIEFVLRATQEKIAFSRLCREFGISRPTGYLWVERYREAGSVRGLGELSRRPHHSPRRTRRELEEAVVALRRRYGWGARKLGVLLREQGYAVPEITIHRLLQRRGLIVPGEVVGQATGRFQRSECNQLAQLDFKGEYGVEGGFCYPLSLLDDCSRYLLGLWALPSPSTEPVQAALEAHFRQQGMPQALLLDHGTPWWSASNGHGLTRLSVWLMKQGIGLCWAGRRHPQTQGKVERLHRTLKARTRHEGAPRTLAGWGQWVQRFRQEYNQRRPHEALGMKTPAQVYRRENLRPYQEPAPEWDYAGAHTQVLNSEGFVTWQGRRWFVCEALVGERVRVEELDDLLVVTFRHTTVREINLRTGKTSAVLLAAPKAPKV